MDRAQEPERALEAFGVAAGRIGEIPTGLINRSFAVQAGDVHYVLQRVSPIFERGIHENIRAVAAHLAARGVPAPRLVPTLDGALYAQLDDDACWRLLTRVEGVGFDVCATPAQARSAGALVGRFHAALADFSVPLHPVGIPLHETETHMARLGEAVREGEGHALHADVSRLADAILSAVGETEPPADLPQRVVHGDLKFNNVLFAGAEGAAAERAVALIDFDTLSRLPLWAELGDAWRSWCNRAGEDEPAAELDADLFRGAAEGWLSEAPAIDARERLSLVVGPERIALELAARFAADALRESYFGWDPGRFESRGLHNLVRATGQLDLYRQLRASRPLRSRILEA